MSKTESRQTESELRAFMQNLFDFNLACNDALLLLLIENEDHLDGKIVPLINHIINAHQIWNNRIAASEMPYGVWEIHKFKDLERLNRNNHEKSDLILKSYPLDQKVHYKNSKGLAFENSVGDILFHVINHSSHHRAQIASMVKNYGINPPVMDYIFYKREP